MKIVPCLVLLLAVAPSAACGGSSGGDTFSISGVVSAIGISKAQVLAADGATEGDMCQGAGTMGAFDEGAEVLVLDADGAKVAVGELSAGKIPEGSSELEQLGFSMCEFIFEVTDIPASDGLFTLQIDESETTFKQGDESLKVTIAGDEYP
ncbi:hypothetical protein QWJ41_20295 [Nocardioides sp. SOB44]|uniref:Uncharacterized protein n=1 Tax=Nocardioides cremeus TaxID=3058044 RepID=A0ABT8TVU0_9ACTN|nr:hypothetical protein [Nocardioides cremeus]MDO3398075.1 hypothetical protein [Nocardioides cremeus]